MCVVLERAADEREPARRPGSALGFAGFDRDSQVRGGCSSTRTATPADLERGRARQRRRAERRSRSRCRRRRPRDPADPGGGVSGATTAGVSASWSPPEARADSRSRWLITVPPKTPTIDAIEPPKPRSRSGRRAASPGRTRCCRTWTDESLEGFVDDVRGDRQLFCSRSMTAPPPTTTKAEPDPGELHRRAPGRVVRAAAAGSGRATGRASRRRGGRPADVAADRPAAAVRYRHRLSAGSTNRAERDERLGADPRGRSVLAAAGLAAAVVEPALVARRCRDRGGEPRRGHVVATRSSSTSMTCRHHRRPSTRGRTAAAVVAEADPGRRASARSLLRSPTPSRPRRPRARRPTPTGRPAARRTLPCKLDDVDAGWLDDCADGLRVVGPVTMLKAAGTQPGYRALAPALQDRAAHRRDDRGKGAASLRRATSSADTHALHVFSRRRLRERQYISGRAPRARARPSRWRDGLLRPRRHGEKRAATRR